MQGSEQPSLPGTQITASFSNDQVSGSAGCNNYSGMLTAEDGYFTVGPIITTRKMCSDPAGIMEQESAYLAALEATGGYQWQQELVNDAFLVTTGQIFYTLSDGTTGVMNFVSSP